MSAADFAKMKDLQRQIDELRAEVAALKVQNEGRKTLSLPAKDRAA